MSVSAPFRSPVVGDRWGTEQAGEVRECPHGAPFMWLRTCDDKDVRYVRLLLELTTTTYGESVTVTYALRSAREQSTYVTDMDNKGLQSTPNFDFCGLPTLR